MFEYCADPSQLSGLTWLSCYLTTGTHFNFYWSFLTVLMLLAVTAPTALAFGFGGAMMARSPVLPVSLIGRGYIAAVRGVPDIVYFLFFVIALDQGLEWAKHLFVCDDLSQPVWQGTEFRVCAAAKVPLATSAAIWHSAYAFAIAVFTFALVFGAFAANVLYGAMQAVPRAQLETGEAYGMTQRQVFRRILVPQMWVFALPGLSNLWLILIKATPLLFLLGIQDIVYWARELGSAKTSGNNPYPHGDWRVFYFLALLVFYLAFTRVSEIVLGRLTQRLSSGQATLGGEQLRKAGA
ncbi:MAG: ABC transporter permease subunit [Fuscovulum sp.]|jgi:polar amino acid transport system permease protein|nr:ABC transporter permease subunit [Paracoccaceae bacterium]MCZ8082885.1 ABC transporter permease subunit [Paracoccaceae bacterium]WRH64116.1 MAG: ABC transporter permease subunit [Fuscovulum sp.]